MASGIFGISKLPVSTMHTAISPEGPISFPKFIPQEIANGKFVSDVFVPRSIRTSKAGIIGSLVSAVAKAARHV